MVLGEDELPVEALGLIEVLDEARAVRVVADGEVRADEADVVVGDGSDETIA